MSQDILSVRPVFALFFPHRTSGCITICWLHRCNNSDIGFCSRSKKSHPFNFVSKSSPKKCKIPVRSCEHWWYNPNDKFFFTLVNVQSKHVYVNQWDISMRIHAVALSLFPVYPRKKMEYQIIVCVCEQLSDIPRGLSPWICCDFILVAALSWYSIKGKVLLAFSRCILSQHELYWEINMSVLNLSSCIHVSPIQLMLILLVLVLVVEVAVVVG